MNLTPDQIPIHLGPIILNATLVFTWFVMGLLILLSWWVTRNLSASTRMSPGQNLLEVLVLGIGNQIRDISEQEPAPYLPFVGTLFIFIAASNLLSILPGYQPPTGSLSTTAALAICVFVAVPLYGIRQRGWRSYLKQYVEPTPIMLPFNLISDVSRIISLAVRLFGNVMSGTMIVAILLSIAPLIFPVVMQAFGLLTGLIQAYIFAVLAMVFIAAATEVHASTDSSNHSDNSVEVSNG
ncbi:MAG: F0F1 ATP synthase subunit A [Cyanobacteria bacterium P01_A01_bin.123]